MSVSFACWLTALFMTAYLLSDHLINLLAPSAFVAVVLVLLGKLAGRIFASNKPLGQSIWVQAAIIFIVNAVVTVAGLVFFGNDGKMATYAAVVVASALTYWVMQRGWKHQ
jgi:hypothetical protein